MEQWDRTVAYWTQHYQNDDIEYAEASEWCWYTESYNDWLLSVATKPTRLFNAGDLVITSRNNGSADRYYAYAVTSKGYPIKRMYLPITEVGGTVSYTPPANIVSMLHGRANASVKGRLLHIFEPPFYLSHRSPHDEQVREYISAMHEGTAEKLVRDAAATIKFVQVCLGQSFTGLGARDPSRPNSDKAYPVSYSELGISAELAQDLKKWHASQYVIGADRKYPPTARLNDEGIALAKHVKQQLGAKTEVVYTPISYERNSTPPVDQPIDL